MIRAIIVDDEPTCSEYLELILSQNNLIKIIGIYNSSEKALDALENIEVDVAFLDIDMPEIDGLTLADMMLDKVIGISVVFVTAFNQYAVEAFKLNALDYILKPISKDRINETINRLAKEKNINFSDNTIIANCFGKLAIYDSNSKNLVKWKTAKSEELFAYLISNLGNDVLIDSISSDIFPHMDFEKAYNNIKTTVYYIKKTLGQLGITNIIISSRGSYRINLDVIECDYIKLLNLSKNNNEINNENITSIEKILNYYKGGFLEKNCYLWSFELMQNLEDEYIRVANSLSKYYISINSFLPAEKLLKKVIKISPIHYNTNKLLIKLYLKMNDRIYALKCFDSYKRKLKEDFGEIPAKELVNLLYYNIE